MTKRQENEIRDLIVRYGDKLTNTDAIAMLSEISAREDINFANLLVIDEMTGVETITLWVNMILTLRVSKSRKGRKEVIETIKGLMVSEKPGRIEKTSMAIKRLMMGEEE